MIQGVRVKCQMSLNLTVRYTLQNVKKRSVSVKSENNTQKVFIKKSVSISA